MILSSSYFHYSSRGLADFALSLSDSFEWLGDKIIAKTSPTSRPFVGCLFTLGALYVYHRYATAFHEMGHGLHYRARGGTFGLYSEGTPNNEVKGKKNENIFRFFLKHTFSMKFGAFTNYNLDDEYIVLL